MSSPEFPRLSLIFSYSDDQGEKDVIDITPMSTPVTPESIQETADTLAQNIGRMLVEQGILPPSEPTEQG